MSISPSSPPVLRRLFLFLLLALLILPGCGRLRRLFASKEPENLHSVTISWTASASPVAGYYVYRFYGLRGPDRLTNSIVPRTQFTDRTVGAGQTYSYYVTAVDSKGTESNPSEKITVTVPMTVTPPERQ